MTVKSPQKRDGQGPMNDLLDIEIWVFFGTFQYFFEAHLDRSLLLSLNTDCVREVVMRRKSVA